MIFTALKLLIICALLVCFAGAQAQEVVADQRIYATSNSHPRILHFGEHWIIAFYDEGENLKLLWPETGESKSISSEGLPSVSNSFIDLAGFDDRLFVTWRAKTATKGKAGAKYLLVSNSADQGKTFSKPIRVSTKGGAFHPLPLASGGDGRVYLVWPDERSSPRDGIFFNRSLDGGNTWLEQELRLDGILQSAKTKTEATRIGFAYDPALAVREKQIWVGWLEIYQKENNHFKIRMSEDAGDTWTEEQIIPRADEARIFAPRLVNTNDGLMAMYFTLESGIVVVRSEDNGVSWQQPTPIPNTEILGSQGLHIAHNNHGNICVAWPGPAKLNRKKADIFVSCSSDHGRSWPQAPTRLDADPVQKSHSLEPAIAMDDVGRTVVTWWDSRDIRADIYVNYSLDGGSTWLKQDLRVNNNIGEQISRFPALATDNQSHFFLVWAEAQSDGVESDFRLAYESLKLPEFARFTFQGRTATLNPSLTPSQVEPPRERLLERVRETWDGYLRQRYSVLYKQMDPFFRARTRDIDFISKISRMTYINYEIMEDTVKIDDRMAEVKVKITYRADNIPVVGTGQRSISIPETTEVITDRWIWIDNDWYRLYQPAATGKSFLPM